MEVAVGAASWVVGKALGPVADGLLEAWAASKELGPNIDALKMELLYAQGMLNNTRGREIDNPALNVLLQKLRDLAYNAEDVLDELDYFRIQDQLEGTYEAADEHAKGCVCNLFLNAHHTARAVGKLLCTSPCSRAAGHGDPSEPTEEDAKKQVPLCAWPCAKRSSARDNTSSVPHHHQADEEVSGCMRKLASSACNAIRDVGKRLHCSSLPLTHDDDDDDNSGMPVLCGACNTRKVSQKKHTKETPKLEFDRVDLSKRMKNIVEQLQPVCAKVTAILNLEFLGSRITDPSIAKSPPTTTSDIAQPTLYGRDPKMKSIIGSITQEDNGGKDPTVLPIVGPGGIGKTTLVQHIYHSEEVQNHFQVKVWVCVSQNFNVNKLTEEIKKAIPSVEGEKEGTSQELIEQRLKSKRLLLILDDIWKCEPGDWERLLVPLRKGQARGNIILVTTRFPAVAEMVKTTGRSSVDLEGLDHEVFRDFFRACIFGEGQSRKDHDGLLLEIGDKIAEKLKGSPLAAKTVGRLLRNHLDHNHWRRVLESREWEMQNGKHDIMPALKLSFDYLPFHLQQCFSYCALFPEDYKFYSEELIHFWIGLDILHSCGSRKKKVEDVGLDCLDDLVNHGFFKKDGTDEHPYYIIHDLLHDLALKVASHECLSLHHSNVRSVEIRPSIRHVSIIIDGADDSYGMPDENFKRELRKLNTRLKVENLQTLIILGGQHKSFVNIFGDLFKEANALRVLCLPIIAYPVEFILCNFSALLHLRYLRLGTTFGTQMGLRTSLSRFYHLRVLYLDAWHGCLDLPREMSNLVKLRHLVIRDCPELLEFPFLNNACYASGKDENIHWLPNLRVFEIKDCPKVLSLPPIPYTDTLCSVDIARVGSGLERLEYSNKGSLLRIEGNETLHSLDDTVLAFHNLNQLQDLRIAKCPPLAEKHLQMLTSLKKLEIYHSSNVFLPLARSDVKWQLPIKRLEVERCGASGKELTQFLSHLPELSALTITNCEKITRLSVEAEQQETAAPISLPSAPAVKMEDAQATDLHQQIAGEVVEEGVAVELVGEQEKEDGLLLIPTHLSDRLQELFINYCSELSLMASPTLPDGHNNKIGGRGGEGGGLQALHSLQELGIWSCPNFLSAYKTSSVCPLPSSLRNLSLINEVGMETFEPLSNLTSLTQLFISNCGEDLRWEGLWPLHTQGQLSYLSVYESPNFFAGRDPMRGLQDEQERQLVSTSFKLNTDDVAVVLVAPVCSLLSSSLTNLTFHLNEEVERFTKEQEEALHLLTSLQELRFYMCHRLRCLPAGLNKLTNLKTLRIRGCPSLRSLPKDGLPSSLQELDVELCNNEELKQKCRRLTGTIPKINLGLGD